MYAAVRVHDLGEQRLDGHQMQVHLLDDGHDGDAGDGRAEERPPVRRARERTLPPDERHDRRIEQQRRELEGRVAFRIEEAAERRRLHRRPRREEREQAEDEEDGGDEVGLEFHVRVLLSVHSSSAPL